MSRMLASSLHEPSHGAGSSVAAEARVTQSLKDSLLMGINTEAREIMSWKHSSVILETIPRGPILVSGHCAVIRLSGLSSEDWFTSIASPPWG